MNVVIVKRSDHFGQQHFEILWSTIHKTCFQAKRNTEKEPELRKRIKEGNERKEKMSKMTADELVEFKRKEQEERNKR